MNIDGNSSLYEHYCKHCSKPAKNLTCGDTFIQNLQPIICPEEFVKTHSICPYCQDLYPKIYKTSHENNCLFYKHGLRLHAGGWSTPTSKTVLKSLRYRKTFQNPISNVLRSILQSLELSRFFVVPIPMGDKKANSTWTNIALDATQDLTGSHEIGLAHPLRRQKVLSTKNSVSQQRAKIVQQEYSIEKSVAEMLQDKVIVVVDDNVTTGTTMVGCIQLLQQFQPSNIIPVTIERYINVLLSKHIPIITKTDCFAFYPEHPELEN